VLPGVLAHAPVLREKTSTLNGSDAQTSITTKPLSQMGTIGNLPSSSYLQHKESLQSSAGARSVSHKTAGYHSIPLPAAVVSPDPQTTASGFSTNSVANAIAPSDVRAPVEQELEKAILLADRGALTEALGILQEVIQNAPLASEAYLLLAQVLQSLGRPEAAVQELKRAIYLDPSNASAQLRLGFLLAEQGGTPAAIRAFRAATALVSGIESPQPELVEIRRTAATQLVRLLREE
jgi:tetratricopeptide (TPR) repeat protein